ncbi:hypothetical protein D9O36_04255 [Zobellia amurskyensis]|uniref:Outer membrane protein beta-barrel domain-containing protein n=1 Tax=Zobellia amurskyensis TaxID=248905 RepID=A0A7X3D116_9FLAO|nr:outer membrane beta-barrel protein [Zobellia amurskyensis]MUH35043.1 hypothetical protein [Zobellia amurskyensis]
MKKIYFLTVSIFFLSASLFAQDKKWSVEANYPISVGDDLGADAPAILDLGLKYRFFDFNIVKIGASISAGYFRQNHNYSINEELFDFTETHWLFQPKLFAEFTIPSIKKLHPSIGLGYTFTESKNKGIAFNEPAELKRSPGGVSLNLGLSYDVTKRFFLQVQCDYTRSTGTVKGEGYTENIKDNLGFV